MASLGADSASAAVASSLFACIYEAESESNDSFACFGTSTIHFVEVSAADVVACVQRGADSMRHGSSNMASSAAAAEYAPFSRAGSAGAGGSSGHGNGSRWMPSGAPRMFGGENTEPISCLTVSQSVRYSGDGTAARAVTTAVSE